MTKKTEAQLGDLVKDKITGFQGILMAKTDWLNGCKRVSIQPKELKDGKAIDMDSFDLAQVEVVEAGAYAKAKEKEKKPGGPRPNPKRPADPTR